MQLTQEDIDAIKELRSSFGVETIAKAVEAALAAAVPASVTGFPSVVFLPAEVRIVGEGEYTDNTGRRKSQGREIRTIVARARINGKVRTLDHSRMIPVSHLAEGNADVLRFHSDNASRNAITRAVMEAAFGKPR
ncbi:hypothetical protein [Stenotrophomonas phage BUCT603B1]|nr:hypothetical protein [Stenotrophomonas phage BUCT603]UOL49240.1 hypothetical protein [Stenotrophomonas phage BUCT603B1]HDS1001998.1 hypothetical protein [Stenotrophomonas maltophilia]